MNETFKRKLDECYEALSEGKDPGTLGLNAVITTAEELEQCLPAIKEENDAINKGITDCDHRIKTWQESKKAWKERQAVLLEIVENALTRLNLKNASNGKVKASITSRRSLEVVGDDLLKPYQDVVNAIAANLPPYVKITLDIDKTALAAHLKTDDTLLLTMPKSLHYKDSKSVKIS